MKDDCGSEQIQIKHKYVFCPNPETGPSCAEKSNASARIQQTPELRQEEILFASQGKSENIGEASKLKNVESFLRQQPVQSHPFTFITAVKRKLAVAAYNETSKRAYNLFVGKTTEPLDVEKNRIDASQESLYQTVKKMDFIKPLKVPDVKISPKTLEYGSKESLNLRDLAGLKISGTSQKNEKGCKSVDRAHRKLDFSLSEGHSFVSSDEIEPLKAPDLSISPSLAKQKDHGRDSSREKENRIKRVKKDDSVGAKMEDVSQESSKKSKNPKHLSRKEKDAVESKRTKTDRSSIHQSRDAEITSKKPKTKTLTTSASRKEEEKRIRSGMHLTKSTRDRSLESRGRTFSSESLPDRCTKIARDQAKVITDSEIHKYNDDYQILHAIRQIEEQKQKSIDAKAPKILGRSSSSQSLKSIEAAAKEQQQHKRIQERAKSANKLQSRGMSSASEVTEDLENTSDTGIAKNRDFALNSNIVTQSSNETTPDEVILDPTKISFRDDSYSQQDEFCDLVTPDMNLNVRSKRRKQRLNESDQESDVKSSKHRARVQDVDSQNSDSSFLHPTALHMQFQAELHLFDSYNESLRQVEGVEKCLYNVKNDRGKELLEKQRLVNDEMRKHLNTMQAERDSDPVGSSGEMSRAREIDPDVGSNEASKLMKDSEIESRRGRPETESRDGKPDVRVAETQTPNDMATQTETRLNRHSVDRVKQYPGITYERGDFLKSDIPELSLGSLEQFEDLDHVEDISLPSKMRTMSEISLHETTSSIKTETGTEISMTTRDVTCSFNKYLDHEMAQLIKDEKMIYDKIELLFKSREKTLNDRTKKLVKLEEQKRALRDTGQDSRSVKKKQRALLLKLQQEKDEMNRLKEMHKMASQERKLMLQKQRNMFNPQMSTKNILTKLKRSADCQSPRRLSGPMKGYDIRSNSSMSSLLESEKAQIDRAQMDMKILLSDSSCRLEGKSVKSDQENSTPEKLEASNERSYLGALETSSLNDLDQLDFRGSFVISPQKLASKTRKFEEKMPNSRSSYLLRNKQLLNSGQIVESHEESQVALKNVENVENAKSESDTLVEELSKKSKALNHENIQGISGQSKESINHENVQQEAYSISRKSKALQVNEESLLQAYKASKKLDKVGNAEKDGSKKLQHHDAKSSSKRKGGKNLKTKSSVLSENIPRAKGNEETTKTTNNKRKTKLDKELMDDHYQSSILEEIDLNESQNSLQALVKHSRAVKDKNYKLLRDIACEQHEIKENIASGNLIDRSSDIRDNDSRRDDPDLHNLGNISTRSQVSTFTISRHSSGDSEKSFSRSVVIRAHDHPFKTSKKLEEALNAREAALVARRNCVEDWIAWHTKLKAEECRVARMEQATLKLVSTAANALAYHDTTMSSDTSDVEGRVELLAEKVAEQRMEMARLRRETRKQTKRRLKALELNLLNQIKKYDTTINEMQLKLESQKGVMKDSEKLAIESRSVADFKVPEIPLKRIQELYKKSDLLRSRSESDLIFSRSRHAGTKENYATTDNVESVYKTSGSQESNGSATFSRSQDLITNQSAESVLEEAKKFSQAVTSSDASSGRESRMTNASMSQERLSRVTDNENKSSVPVGESEEISEAIGGSDSMESSRLFSQKLQSLHLTDKNLNDDISTLENDLKVLSEMMSQFSKKSDDKLKSGSQILSDEQNDVRTVESSPKNTSRNISEEFSKSIHSEIIEEVSSVPEELEIVPESSVATEIQEKIKSAESSTSHEEIIDKVNELISTAIPEEESESKPNEEIDFEARSKEILSVIEKSIISEHIESVDKISTEIEESIDIDQESEEISERFSSQEDSLPILNLEKEKYVEAEKSENERTFELESAEHKSVIPSVAVSTNIGESPVKSERENSPILKGSLDDKIEDKSEKIDGREESIDEEISASQQEEAFNDTSMISKKSAEISHEEQATENNRTNESSLENVSNNEESLENYNISHDKNSVDNDWTVSESFKVPNETIDTEKSLHQEPSISMVPSQLSVTNFGEEDSQRDIENDESVGEENMTCDEVSMFLPKGESTKIGYRFDESLANVENPDPSRVDELDDIMDIIARDSEEKEPFSIPQIVVTDDNEAEITTDIFIPRPTDLNLTAEVEPVLQKLTEIIQGVKLNIALRRKKSQGEIEEKIPESVEPASANDDVTSKMSILDIEKLTDQVSDLETRVSEIIPVQKSPVDSPRGLTIEEVPEETENDEKAEEKIVEEEKSLRIEGVAKLADKTFDILRDPEYEDISEESLEVSEILDRSESQRSTGSSSRSKKIPEKYEIKQKSDDVLRILDEISQKSYPRTEEHVHDVQISVQVFGQVSPGLASDDGEAVRGQIVASLQDDAKSVEIEIISLNDRKETISPENEEKIVTESVGDLKDEVSGKQEMDASSESSEGADTPRGVSEIEMDSPRDPNESRLDIDALDDDLLSIGDTGKQNESKIDFPVTTTVVSSEKDIETMINKLKASLEQPGLEVAELEAKLLRIEQLQIELEIKKLEAEEVSYYMREIPNKPPPPYTPPGGGRLMTPQVSPTLPSTVVPSSVEELTAFTEKATVLIFNAKNSGQDIMNLQPPPEIMQLGRDMSESGNNDRRIYNTFLFDLCKETIAELYRSEYEKPGPSWTKPNVKTKPAMKIPKTIEELNEYVNKEVATLFGFKTKLQRENMVMRWSRKRRDRVDELLAREAQAEEDEWTKFHDDELAVKNELTIAILDTLILETANCVKAVYAKKRKFVVT